MANFAVIKDNAVINIITANSLQIAQEVTGLTCIEYTDDNPAAIGDKFEETPTKKVK
jgi:hypothetical protein